MPYEQIDAWDYITMYVLSMYLSFIIITTCKKITTIRKI